MQQNMRTYLAKNGAYISLILEGAMTAAAIPSLKLTFEMQQV